MDAIAALALKALAFGGAFALSIAVARILSPDEAGYFFLVLTIVTVVSTATRLGTDKPIVRYVAARIADGSRVQAGPAVTGTLLIVGLVSLAAGSAMSWGATWIASSVFSKPELGSLLAWMAWSIPALAVSGALSFALQGMGRITIHLLLLSVVTPVAAVAFILIWLQRTNSGDAAALYCAAAMLNLVLALVTFWIFRDPLVARPSWNALRSVVSSSKATFVVTAAQLGILWLPMMLLGAYAAPEELADYHVASRTSMLIGFVLIAVNSVDAPKYAALYATMQLDQLQQLARQTTRLMTLMAFPIAIVFLAAPHLILQIFGGAFSEAAPALRIMTIGQFVATASGSVANLLLMTGHERDFRNICLGAVAFSAIAGLVLIPRCGATGAAIVMATTLALVNVLSLRVATRRLGFHGVRL